MSEQETTGPEFIAVALQVACNGVNLISDVGQARARIAENIAKIEGYVTDITTDISLEWLENRDRDRPFFIMIHNKAPHGPWQPARRHENQFDGKTVPEPASLRERGNHGPGPEVVVDGVAGFQFGSSISRRYNERSYTRRFLHRASKSNKDKQAMGHKTPPLPPVSEEELAEETGIPYQNLINLYLRDCVASGRRPSLKWAS